MDVSSALPRPHRARFFTYVSPKNALICPAEDQHFNTWMREADYIKGLNISKAQLLLSFMAK
jgi:hypothetical protein